MVSADRGAERQNAWNVTQLYGMSAINAWLFNTICALFLQQRLSPHTREVNEGLRGLPCPTPAKAANI